MRYVGVWTLLVSLYCESTKTAEIQTMTKNGQEWQGAGLRKGKKETPTVHSSMAFTEYSLHCPFHLDLCAGMAWNSELGQNTVLVLVWVYTKVCPNLVSLFKPSISLTNQKWGFEGWLVAWFWCFVLPSVLPFSLERTEQGEAGAEPYLSLSQQKTVGKLIPIELTPKFLGPWITPSMKWLENFQQGWYLLALTPPKSFNSSCRFSLVRRACRCLSVGWLSG